MFFGAIASAGHQAIFAISIHPAITDEKSTWSEEAGATVVSFSSDLAVPNEPDRVKVTVGQDVMIDLNETQVLPRCGAEAEFPKFIVIPEKGKLCRVKLGE